MDEVTCGITQNKAWARVLIQSHRRRLLSYSFFLSPSLSLIPADMLFSLIYNWMTSARFPIPILYIITHIVPCDYKILDAFPTPPPCLPLSGNFSLTHFALLCIYSSDTFTYVTMFHGIPSTLQIERVTLCAGKFA